MREIIFDKDKQVKLIATDMDGTLLDDEKNLPPKFWEQLDELKKLGIHFVAASGRSFVSLRMAFEESEENLDYICDNGAYIIRDGKVVFISAVDHEIIYKLSDECKKIGVIMYLCAVNGTYHLSENAEHFKEVKNYYPNLKSVNDFRDVDDTVFKITIFDPDNPLNGSYKALNDKFGECMNVQVSGVHWIDVMNMGISKGSAIIELQKELGIKYEETMSFGDFYNDAEMLQNSYYGVVMANANEDMKQYGNFDTLSNNENGVGIVLQKIIDNRK